MYEKLKSDGMHVSRLIIHAWFCMRFGIEIGIHGGAKLSMPYEIIKYYYALFNNFRWHTKLYLVPVKHAMLHV